MNLLILTDEPPASAVVGSAPRYYHLVKHMARHHRVSLVCLSRSPADRQSLPELREVCEAVEVVQVGRKRLGHLFHCLRALLRGQPVLNGFFDSGLRGQGRP